MFTLPLWLTNIWVRRAILAVVVAIALLAVRQHYIDLGKKEGVASESQKTADTSAASVKADRDSTVPQITVLTNQLSVLTQQTQNLQQAVLSLATQRQVAAQQLPGLTAAQVETIIDQHLKKQPGTPDTPQDRQQIAGCFQQLDLCNQQISQGTDMVAKLNSSVQTSSQRYDLLAGYATRLEKSYTDLWNDKSTARRSARCVWLWHCFKPQIKEPDPKLLLQRPDMKGETNAAVH